MNQKPAVLGGKPAFEKLVPIVKPPIEAIIDKTLSDYKAILESRMVTNFTFVKELEKAVAAYIGVNYCVATANCTAGLMLTLQALKIKTGEVLIPSFTFPATAHAVHWNRMRLRLVDCNVETFNMDVEDLQEKITSESKVVIPVHVFGNPCETRALEETARDHGLKVIYDSAHGFGAKYNDIPVGQFGEAEVFSGSPTKAFTTIEGGIITTNNAKIAETVKATRNYGHYGNYDCELPGLSARMSELHAALGLNLLSRVEAGVKKRNLLAKKYREGLSELPGLSFQKITADSLSTYKDFGVLVDEREFGLSRDELAVCLEKENIMTRKYFYPPLHMQTCYPQLKAENEALPNTSQVANNIICLPMFSELTEAQVNEIMSAIMGLHVHADEIRSRP